MKSIMPSVKIYKKNNAKRNDRKKAMENLLVPDGKL